MEKIREPIVEGIFYPSDNRKLEKLVNSLVEAADVEKGDAWGIVAPHAGFRYSGAIAAAAFKAAAARTLETVVLLAPLHRTGSDEVVFPESASFRMPMGPIYVNRAAVDELVDCSTQFLLDDIPHLEEHSIEVQLPFVATLFPRASIVPILIGNVKRSTVAVLVRALKLVFDASVQKTLFAVSANLTSFMQGMMAKQEAMYILDAIQRNDPECLLADRETGKINSIGVPAIATLMLLADRKYRPTILESGNSGEINQDFREMVQYAAIAFCRKER